MRTQALWTYLTRSLLLSALIALAMPASFAAAQDEEEEAEEEESSDDLDSMMATDPERAPEPEDESEGDGSEGGGEQMRDEEGFKDEERPPGEEPEESEEPSEEPAPEPESGTEGFNIGILLGYGLSLEKGANIWSAGFGLQAVYDTGVFVIGPRFVYYLGGSAEFARIDTFGEPIGTRTVTANLWELTLDVALDFELSEALYLRPGVGFGFASVSAGSSELVGAVSPGAQLQYDVIDSVYIGLDARIQFAMQETVAKGLIFLATLGFRI